MKNEDANEETQGSSTVDELTKETNQFPGNGEQDSDIATLPRQATEQPCFDAEKSGTVKQECTSDEPQELTTAIESIGEADFVLKDAEQKLNNGTSRKRTIRVSNNYLRASRESWLGQYATLD